MEPEKGKHENAGEEEDTGDKEMERVRTNRPTLRTGDGRGH